MQTEPLFAACFNRPYVPHVAAMLRSVAESAVAPSRWYLVGDDSVDDELLRRLADFARSSGLDAQARRVPAELVEPFDSHTERYPRSVWYRAAFAEAFPDDERLVYLDTDVLVLHDLRALWETPLEDGHFFAALASPTYGGGAILNNERLGMPPDAPYLNSGVMVMDLALMRAEGFHRQTVDFVVSSSRPSLMFPDQDALNMVFAGRWTRLDPTWNCLTVILLPFLLGASWSEDTQHSALTLERAARSPAVVHFEGPPTFKPWHRRCINPFAGLYRQYRATTPWPLTALEGQPRDVALARVPPRVQAWLWHIRARQRRLTRTDG